MLLFSVCFLIGSGTLVRHRFPMLGHVCVCGDLSHLSEVQHGRLPPLALIDHHCYVFVTAAHTGNCKLGILEKTRSFLMLFCCFKSHPVIISFNPHSCYQKRLHSSWKKPQTATTHCLAALNE